MTNEEVVKISFSGDSTGAFWAAAMTKEVQAAMGWEQVFDPTRADVDFVFATNKTPHPWKMLPDEALSNIVVLRHPNANPISMGLNNKFQAVYDLDFIANPSKVWPIVVTQIESVTGRQYLERFNQTFKVRGAGLIFREPPRSQSTTTFRMNLGSMRDKLVVYRALMVLIGATTTALMTEAAGLGAGLLVAVVLAVITFLES